MMIINPYRFGGASSLLTNLVSWWSLGEASGSRADSHGSNTLTDNATVTQATGKIGNAAQFTMANSEYLSVAAGHGLQGGERDWTFAAWFYPDSVLVVQTIACVGASGTNWDWALQIDTGLKYKAYVSSSGGASSSITATTSASAATWQHILCQFNNATNTIGISVNNETLATSAGPATSKDGGGAFTLATFLGVGRYYGGRTDEACFWNRVLTAGERTDLYNSGSGMAYPG